MATSAHGTYYRWQFVIEDEGEQEDHKVYANVSDKFGPQSKARRWCEQMIGRSIRKGEQFDTEVLLGQPYHIMVTNTPEDERGRVYDNVENVHRIRPKAEPKQHEAGQPGDAEGEFNDIPWDSGGLRRPSSAGPPHSQGVQMTVYINPHILPVKAGNIPGELKARPQWVLWMAVGDKPDKVPFSARTGRRASSTDLLTWGTFQEALEAYKNGEYAGRGFVFSSADPFTGIDMDDCVDADGEIALWALEIARYFESYTEISATGTGLHIIVRGEIPNRRKGDVEVYSSKRFFTMTGHVVEVSGD